MTTSPSSTLTHERLDLADYEFEIPCEYSQHEKFGTGPAEWTVHIIRVCCGADLTRFDCDPCLAHIKSLPEDRYYCPECHDDQTVCRPADEIISQLRIKPNGG